MIFEYKIDYGSFAPDSLAQHLFRTGLNFEEPEQTTDLKAAGQTSHLRGENESEGANGASRYVQTEKYRLPKLFPQKLELTVLWSSYNEMVTCLVL